MRKADADPARTPFTALDEWNESHGYADDSVESALRYVESLREERVDGDVKKW